ncbi:MAG: cell division protein FtsL [Maricaulaceae bacterium]
MSNSYHTQADALRRLTAFLLLLLGVSLMAGLYYVKTRAQTAKNIASQLEYKIGIEEAAISVLHAEIAHLENPARLQRLAQSELGLGIIPDDHIIEMSDIEAIFPVAEALADKGIAQGGQP